LKVVAQRRRVEPSRRRAIQRKQCSGRAGCFDRANCRKIVAHDLRVSRLANS
jgi:hypothetical protein